MMRLGRFSFFAACLLLAMRCQQHHMPHDSLNMPYQDIKYRCLFGNALRTLAIPAHYHWQLSAGAGDTPATCSRCGSRLVEGAVEGIRTNVDSTVWFDFV